MNRQASLQALLHEHRLPAAYLQHAQQWFDPLAQELCTLQNGANAPLIIGLNGCQGSGKSTLSDYLQRVLACDHGLHIAVMSLDDFYLTHGERLELAHSVHPLLQTRGVPGTHDIELLQGTLAALRAGEQPALPRFDKARDDRSAPDTWCKPERPVDMILLEGWCLGVPAQAETALVEPVNDLEAREDTDGKWRGYVNRTLAAAYEPLYATINHWVMLSAPSFDTVYRWRLEQEEKLAARGSGSGVMDAAGVRRFIQHYQRLTEHGLNWLSSRAHSNYQLDAQRQIVGRDRGPGPQYD